MWQKIVYVYGIVAMVLFVSLLGIGKICKKDLGKGVKLGVLNSFILSVLWPVSFLVTLSGVCYEVVHIWKRL